MRLTLFSLASMVLLSCGGEAQFVAAPPTPLSPPESLETLLTATVFTDGRFGMTCTMRPEVIAFQALFNEPTAPRDFEFLTLNGNLQGQLYGLCGLFLLAPERFDELVPQFAMSDEHVLQAVPCMLNHPKVSTVIKSDSPDTVRLRYPSQPLKEWLLEHPDATPSSLIFDIVGGGYTASLLAADGCDPKEKTLEAGKTNA